VNPDAELFSSKLVAQVVLAVAEGKSSLTFAFGAVGRLWRPSGAKNVNEIISLLHQRSRSFTETEQK
jgi:hypothetical protein